MAQFSFDTQSAPKSDRNYDLLPAGWYPARVTESALEKTSTGKGTALKLTFEIIDGPAKNRKVWARLNVRHENETAERIGNEQLRELCESINVMRMQDTVELHNKPVRIRVKVRKAESEQYEDQNEVAGYKAIGASTAAAVPPASGGFARPPATQPPAAPAPSAPAPATQAAAAPVQQSSAPVPPWQRR